MDTEQVIRLSELFAEARGMTLSTVSTYAANDGKVVARLRRGADITTRRAARIVQWFSDNWPADLEWPADVPRPEPSPESPAANPPPPADPLAAVREAKERLHAETSADGVDWEAAKRHKLAMLRAGTTLRADGRIASVEALCEAVGVPRHVYDDVVRRYAGAPPGRRPRRPDSDTGLMLAALEDSGDVRFAHRRRDAA